MKDFTEFASSLTQVDLEWLCGANDEPKTLAIRFAEENFGNKLAAFILEQNFQINLRLLELYHEWLSGQD